MNLTKISQVIDTDREEDVVCPFCKESGFDLAGLKGHLERGLCEIYNAIDISDIRRLMDNF